MCIMCVEIEKNKMSGQEAIRNFFETRTTISAEHEKEVIILLNEYVKEKSSKEETKLSDFNIGDVLFYKKDMGVICGFEENKQQFKIRWFGNETQSILHKKIIIEMLEEKEICILVSDDSCNE